MKVYSHDLGKGDDYAHARLDRLLQLLRQYRSSSGSLRIRVDRGGILRVMLTMELDGEEREQERT